MRNDFRKMNQKSKILIVEDNSDVRELMAVVLRRSGFEVVEAANGVEALDRTHTSHPDLIIMDLGLPKMTGDEATARIKADPFTRDIPVIVNTAFNDNEFIQRAIFAGAAEVLRKPTELKVLIEVIGRHLSLRQNRAVTPNSTAGEAGGKVSAAI